MGEIVWVNVQSHRLTRRRQKLLYYGPIVTVLSALNPRMYSEEIRTCWNHICAEVKRCDLGTAEPTEIKMW
jgi:hypothetical protein